MIGLATQETQTDGAVVIYERANSELKRYQPRASRVALLDGTSEVIHSGVSDGDRIFRVYADVTEEEAAKIKSIYDAGQMIHFSCSEGFFLGYISDVRLDNGDLRLTYYVKERLSQ